MSSNITVSKKHGKGSSSRIRSKPVLNPLPGPAPLDEKPTEVASKPSKLQGNKKLTKKRQLAPLRKSGLTNEKSQHSLFETRVKEIEQLIALEDLEPANDALDALVAATEQSHYLTKELRQQHVQELYRLSEALDNLDEHLQKHIQKNRTQGNEELELLLQAIEDHDLTTAQQKSIRATAAYRRAKDLRWQAVPILYEKLAANVLCFQAHAAFDRAQVDEAIKLATEARGKYKVFRQSKYQGQCNLMLSIGSSSMGWNHSLHSAIEKDQQESISQCSDPYAYFRDKAKTAIDTNFMQAKKFLNEEKMEEAGTALDHVEKYCLWLNLDAPDLLIGLRKKVFILELQKAAELLGNPSTPPYQWSKVVEGLLRDIKTPEHCALVHQQKILSLVCHAAQTGPEDTKVATLTLQMIQILREFKVVEIYLHEIGIFPTLLALLQHTNSVEVKHRSMELVMAIATSKQLTHVVLKLQVIPIVVGLRQAYLHEPTMLLQFAKLFDHLAINAKAADLLMQQEGVVTILRILRRCQQHDQLVDVCLHFFTRLLSFPEAIEWPKLYDQNLITILLDATQAHASHSKIVFQFAQILDHLSYDERARLLFVKQDASLLLQHGAQKLEFPPEERAYFERLAMELLAKRVHPDDIQQAQVEEGKVEEKEVEIEQAQAPMKKPASGRSFAGSSAQTKRATSSTGSRKKKKDARSKVEGVPGGSDTQVEVGEEIRIRRGVKTGQRYHLVSVLQDKDKCRVHVVAISSKVKPHLVSLEKQPAETLTSSQACREWILHVIASFYKESHEKKENSESIAEPQEVCRLPEVMQTESQRKNEEVDGHALERAKYKQESIVERKESIAEQKPIPKVSMEDSTEITKQAKVNRNKSDGHAETKEYNFDSKSLELQPEQHATHVEGEITKLQEQQEQELEENKSRQRSMGIKLGPSYWIVKFHIQPRLEIIEIRALEVKNTKEAKAQVKYASPKHFTRAELEDFSHAALAKGELTTQTI